MGFYNVPFKVFFIICYTSSLVVGYVYDLCSLCNCIISTPQSNGFVYEIRLFFIRYIF